MILRNDYQPLVSVIMPTYNQGRYIYEAIQSVLSQTYRHLELIIIDNYSTDETERAIAKFQDHRVKYSKFNNEGIIAASRNQGIKLAQGDYIAFLDSDDIWLPGKLEKAVSVLSGSEAIALTYSRFRTLTGNTVSMIVLPKPGHYQSGQVFKALYKRSFIACSGVMVKKSVLQQVGVFNTDPAFLALEDTDLWLRIARRYDIICTAEAPLFLYRVNPQGISRGFLKKIRRSWVMKKNYIKPAGKYLFCRSLLLSVLDIVKQGLMSRSHKL